MEDRPEQEKTPAQPEDRPAEAGAEIAEQATPPAVAEAETPAEPETTEAAPIAQTTEAAPIAQTPETAPVAETPEPAAELKETKESKPEAAPPAKPTGPRIASLRPGSVVEGKVTRIERYGAFVDLGLVERRDGLIHISELASYRVRRVEDVVQVGDEVKARVVSVDLGRGRIALSLNDVEANQYDAEAASRSNEPTLTSMAAAFERAYGRLRDEQAGGGSSGGRVDKGSKAKREQELLMEKLRSGRR